MSDSVDPRHGSVAVIGSGVAGLITAHTLIRDGFEDVRILTRDTDVGGVWATGRIYPGLYTNNVHGEYRLSPLEMSPPAMEGIKDPRLSGDDLCKYMNTFASKFLDGKIHFGIEVQSIRRSSSGSGWTVVVLNKNTNAEETHEFAKIVLCTGGCNTPSIPEELSPEAAKAAGFKGTVFHSVEFGSKMSDLLAAVPAAGATPESEDAPVVVIGGGKSAQDICAYLANEGRPVTIVCPDYDAFTAGPKPLPDFIRKSRVLSLFSPHIHLRTSLERFLHTTAAGKKIVNFWWHGLEDSSFSAMGIPADSPLRNTMKPYWHIRVNDEGVPRDGGFHRLALAGKITAISPSRVSGYTPTGVVLDDGRQIAASAVIVATGYKSSWPTLFDDETLHDLSLAPEPAEETPEFKWDYPSLEDAPPLHPEAKRWSSTLYRGMVPYKHIARRDFAVNGAVVSPNFGYTVEVMSHWISAYFLGDEMRLPATPEEALQATRRDAAWLKKRYPQLVCAPHASHLSYLAFWSWAQHADDLLEDLGLPVMRNGGNWLTWPFKVVDLKEISTLKEERDAKRAAKKV